MCQDTIEVNKDAVLDILHAMGVLIDVLRTKYISKEDESRLNYVTKLIESSDELMKRA